MIGGLQNKDVMMPLLVKTYNNIGDLMLDIELLERTYEVYKQGGKPKPKPQQANNKADVKKSYIYLKR